MKVRDALTLLKSDGWYLVATEGSGTASAS
jgi:predicted RNA binding protein YcfA (HicA-like mRNA interferase family)